MSGLQSCSAVEASEHSKQAGHHDGHQQRTNRAKVESTTEKTVTVNSGGNKTDLTGVNSTAPTLLCLHGSETR